MVTKKKARPLYQRIAIDIAGFGLMIAAPLLGWLPGPGGLPLFIAGLGLVSLNHEWAERLLKDIDKKRIELTEKYLMTSPRVSLAVDILSAILLIVGMVIIYVANTKLQKAPGASLAVISIIILLSNQKRLDKISKKFRQIFRTKHKQ